MKNKGVGRLSALTFAFCFTWVGVGSPAYSATPFDKHPGELKGKITEEWQIQQEMEIDRLRNDIRKMSSEISLANEKVVNTLVAQTSPLEKGSYKRKAVINGVVIYYSNEDKIYMIDNGASE